MRWFGHAKLRVRTGLHEAGPMKKKGKGRPRMPWTERVREAVDRRCIEWDDARQEKMEEKENKRIAGLTPPALHSIRSVPFLTFKG